nr:hypothetical protein CFP56_13375 [Quercus suber]
MADTTPTLGKRKRAAVCYAENETRTGDDHHQKPASENHDSNEYGKPKKETTVKRKKAKRVKRSAVLRERQQPVEKQFDFLGLPFELRRMIYGYALTDKEVKLEIRSSRSRHTVRRASWSTVDMSRNTISPALLAVNKQVHAEGVLFLYEQRFLLLDFKTTCRFLRQIGPTNRALLTDITIQDWGEHSQAYTGFAMLGSCVHLRSLFFSHPFHWIRDMDCLARFVYVVGHRFIVAYGEAKGREDAALDVIHVDEKTIPDNFHLDDGDRGTLRESFRAELRRLME